MRLPSIPLLVLALERLVSPGTAFVGLFVPFPDTVLARMVTGSPPGGCWKC
jgi:hypothetical protein